MNDRDNSAPYINPFKVFVAVDASFKEDGTMLPQVITWEDGTRYEIDRIMEICSAAAMKAGGRGDRYTVRVRGRESYLFFERNCTPTGNNIGRWFVERKS